MTKPIKLGAITGTLLIILTMAYQLYEKDRQLRVLKQDYTYFKNDFVKSKEVNERFKKMYDKLQIQYEQLADGSYCINSIEEGGE